MVAAAGAGAGAAASAAGAASVAAGLASSVGFAASAAGAAGADSVVVVAGAAAAAGAAGVSSFLGSSAGLEASAVAAGAANKKDMHQFTVGVMGLFTWWNLPAGAVSVLAGSVAAAAAAGVASAGLDASAGLAASAGLDSAFFSSFFLKTALNLAFKLLSAFGAVRGAGQHWNESERGTFGSRSRSRKRA